jgi:hypothetical protein
MGKKIIAMASLFLCLFLMGSPRDNAAGENRLNCPKARQVSLPEARSLSGSELSPLMHYRLFEI